MREKAFVTHHAADCISARCQTSSASTSPKQNGREKWPLNLRGEFLSVARAA
jgi:hypothetical protein